MSFTPQGIRNIQRWSGQPGPSQGDIKQTWTHRGPGDQLGCQGRDDCREIGLKVKLASSSLSVCDLRAHHHLSRGSYLPTMSTPCKGFLDLLVCIQRAAAKIVVLADGLDHIIPSSPRSSLAPSFLCLNCGLFTFPLPALHYPPLLHPSSPMQQRLTPLSFSNKPLHVLSCSAPHLGGGAFEHLQSHHIALLEALLCHDVCRNLHSRAAVLGAAPCSLTLPGLPAPSCCFFTPACAAQSFVLRCRLCGSTALGRTWSSPSDRSPKTS